MTHTNTQHKRLFSSNLLNQYSYMLYLVGLREFDRAQTLGATVGADEDVGPEDRPSIPHVVLKVLPLNLVRQIADENLFFLVFLVVGVGSPVFV